MTELKLFAPASIANLNCGFDVIGVCLQAIGDEMIFRKTAEKGLRITKITGASLPFEIDKNVAGVAAQAVLDEVGEPDFGIEIEIHKKIRTGSGIGSSSASASGAAFGVNALLGYPLSKKELVAAAMKGEALASGSEHADNVAPCMLGNFTLIRGYGPLDVVQIPSPSDLFAVVLHPQIEIKTADARAVLEPTISLKAAITQWGNLGGLVAGLCTQDYDLIGRSLQDVVIEPLRKKLIPFFDELKRAALHSGALGAGISGAGPSVFALCRGRDQAEKTAFAMHQAYVETGIEFDMHISAIDPEGVRIME
ncbi:homoserine kinase [Flavobacterium sp.]|uniref:homoserine kinase n=1 Tax=Flavobacterium sp. TaxID=239 RepID=UPI0022CCD1DC|nr:homoserine kinase [Flavobacterium sp.]MCZ8145635.1 homoserine kinase [Flavobacterium sp.]MCZ8367249.1 homoserine kinase [Flavobacterium sp.]